MIPNDTKKTREGNSHDIHLSRNITAVLFAKSCMAWMYMIAHDPVNNHCIAYHAITIARNKHVISLPIMLRLCNVNTAHHARCPPCNDVETFRTMFAFVLRSLVKHAEIGKARTLPHSFDTRVSQLIACARCIALLSHSLTPLILEKVLLTKSINCETKQA